MIEIRRASDTATEGDRESAPLIDFSQAFCIFWWASNQIKETPQGWESFTKPLSHNMHLWGRMVQGMSSLGIKQLTWILVCWAIISSRFEKRKQTNKKVGLRQNQFCQQRRGKKSLPLQFISSCCLVSSGLLNCSPLTRIISSRVYFQGQFLFFCLLLQFFKKFIYRFLKCAFFKI